MDPLASVSLMSWPCSTLSPRSNCTQSHEAFVGSTEGYQAPRYLGNFLSEQSSHRHMQASKFFVQQLALRSFPAPFPRKHGARVTHGCSRCLPMGSPWSPHTPCHTPGPPITKNTRGKGLGGVCMVICMVLEQGAPAPGEGTWSHVLLTEPRKRKRLRWREHLDASAIKVCATRFLRTNLGLERMVCTEKFHVEKKNKQANRTPQPTNKMEFPVQWQERSLWHAVGVVIAAPLIWNVVARAEYHTRFLRALCGGNKYTACYALALWIFGFSLYRDLMYVHGRAHWRPTCLHDLVWACRDELLVSKHVVFVCAA